MKALRLLLLAAFVIGGLIYLNTIIPQPQKVQAVSQVFHNSVDTCGDVHVAYVSDPACTSGSYAPAVQLTSSNGGTYTVNPLFQNFFCTGNGDLGDGTNPSSCIRNGKANTAPVVVRPGSPVTITAPMQAPSQYGFTNACGQYQSDFSFTIQGTSCYFGTDATAANASHQVWAYSSCSTNTACQTVTPTPTATPTPVVPTPTPQLTHKACQNNACVLVHGAGDNACRHNSDCQVVPTPTPTAGPTPTPVVPTATPTPTTQIITCFNKDNQLIQVGVNDIALCQTVTQINNQNVTIENSGNNQQQQQQSQAVLAASVAPAVSTSQLPSTGSGTEVLFTLLSLLPVGLKLRKLV